MIRRHHLLLFTRYPDSGKTKTRLIPALGADGAARLQRLLTEKIVAEANILSQENGITTIVHYTGSDEETMASWLGPLTYVAQTDGDLGLRMHMAFADSFSRGAKSAVLIGSDIPNISANLLAGAFAALRTAKVTLGPSRDGGYYLIGLRAEKAAELYPLLFKQMVWSTSEVLAITCRRLQHAAVFPAILATLSDIDTPEDLFLARTQGLL